MLSLSLNEQNADGRVSNESRPMNRGTGPSTREDPVDQLLEVLTPTSVPTLALFKKIPHIVRNRMATGNQLTCLGDWASFV